MPTVPTPTPVERLMIFREWGKRCVWCKQPLTYDSLEIDHLVARSLTGARLNQALTDYGLPSSFDLHALSNLAPSCRRCNGSKGNRPLRGAPIVVAVLDKARQRAPRIAKRVAEFDRSRTLREITLMMEIIRPTAKEMEELNELATSRHIQRRPANYFEPEPPALKRSKRRLHYDGFTDEEQMLILLENWATNQPEAALQIVDDTFNGGDTPPKHVSPVRIDFLAYAKDVGDFLARVTFSVDYLYITDDVSDMAETEHSVDMWITLDPTSRQVVDVVEDRFDSLDACSGYRSE